MRRIAFVVMLVAGLTLRVHAQRGLTPTQDSILRRRRDQMAVEMTARAQWIRDTKPCTPPPFVDTAEWRPARLPDGQAANALLPPGFVFDSTTRFFHGGVQWRRGRQVFARMRGWFGLGNSTACRLPLGGQSYIVSVQTDSGGVSLFAVPADTIGGESEGLYAASPRVDDVDLLWAILRSATPICDRYLLGKGAEAISPNDPCPDTKNR